MGDMRMIHAEVQQALHPDIPIRIVRGAVVPPHRDLLGHTAPRRRTAAPPLTLDEGATRPTTRSAQDETALTLLCLALLCAAASILLVWLLLSFAS